MLTSSAIELLAGGVGGVCSVLVGHSLDTMKVILQTSTNKDETNARAFRSLGDIVRKEGFLALYRGVQAPLIGAMPTYALYFFSYNLGKKLQKPTLDDGKHRPRSFGQFFLAGAFSGVCTVIFSVPIERVKCLLQIEKTKKYSGMLDCTRQIYKSSGLKGLYKGLLLTVYRDLPASGVYFLSYEYIKKLLKKDDGLSPLRTVLAGGTAGVSYWIVGLPMDTLKSCYQTAPDGKYKSIFDAYLSLTRLNGFKSLYRGIIPVLIRTFPATGACFLGYELALFALTSSLANNKDS